MTERISKTEPPALLPDEVLWAEGGHASDVVLTALADGEAGIVPRAVASHVGQCSVCTAHLGNAALLALHVDREMAAGRALAPGAHPSHAPSHAPTAALHAATASLPPPRLPLPRRWIAFGLVVALLGLLPSVQGGGAGLTTFLAHDVPLLVRGLNTIALRFQSAQGPLAIILPYATAALLLAMGFAVTRVLPKKETSR